MVQIKTKQTYLQTNHSATGLANNVDATNQLQTEEEYAAV
jgi:hypothetical protein